jgi:tripartite-type tricarboxylate transporter receptor subunit TctC
MTHVIRWCLALCVLLISPAIAPAQGTYPDRPIRFVVAFPPGGATDTFFRQISNELAQTLGAAIVIENKGGAGGYVGWQYVASSAPDGYTFLVAENALGINPALYKKHPSGFDPLRDFDAVVAMGSTPLVFTIANNIPANTFAEFVAWSKTQPQKFDYGSAGNGSVAHLVTEVILDGAGMQAVHVPYRGGGPAAAAIAGAQVAAVASALPVAKGQMEGKLVKGLAVTSARRRCRTRRHCAVTSVSKWPTSRWNSGGGSSRRKARPSRSAPRSSRLSKPPWRILPCGSGS